MGNQTKIVPFNYGTGEVLITFKYKMTSRLFVKLRSKKCTLCIISENCE